MISRRSLLMGIGASLVAVAAPAIIKTPGVLMPVHPRLEPCDKWVTLQIPLTWSMMDRNWVPPEQLSQDKGCWYFQNKDGSWLKFETGS